jgi:hypothetical protein
METKMAEHYIHSVSAHQLVVRHGWKRLFVVSSAVAGYVNNYGAKS